MRRVLLTLAIAAGSLAQPPASAQAVQAASAATAQPADACRQGPGPLAAPCSGNACRPGVRTAGATAAPLSVAVSCVASAAAAAPARLPASTASQPSPPSPTAWAASSAEAADQLRRDEHRLHSGLLIGAIGIAAALAVVAVVLMLQAGAQARRDGGLRATSHWGGFGGSGGGWQVAPALAFLVAAAVLALAAAVIVASVLGAMRPATTSSATHPK